MWASMRVRPSGMRHFRPLWEMWEVWPRPPHIPLAAPSEGGECGKCRIAARTIGMDCAEEVRSPALRRAAAARLPGRHGRGKRPRGGLQKAPKVAQLGG